MTPIGLALAAGGIASFIFFGRFILPQGEIEEHGHRGQGLINEDPFSQAGELYELTTPGDFTHYRDPVTVRELRDRYLCTAIAMTEPPDFKTLSPPADTALHSGIEIVVCGRKEDVERVAAAEGMALKDRLDVYRFDLDAAQAGIVEAVVSPRSNLIGKTQKDVNLRDRFRISPLSIYRPDETYCVKRGEIRLQVGDVIRLFGTWK